MGISVVNYKSNGDYANSWGVLRDDNVYPLNQSFASHKDVIKLFNSAPSTFRSLISTTPLNNQSPEYNAPVSTDIQLFCQGLNYADHREESGKAKDQHVDNLIFMKAASSICGPNDTILRPKGCVLLDYEIELGIVLKKNISKKTDIKSEDLHQYIGALVLCNDVSARDLMFGAPMLQWFKGKSQRTFCPIGPVLYLMEKQDFDKLFDLQLTLKLNGETKQAASTQLMIHRPADTLCEISSYADMQIGDCILTGTPGGILAGANLKTGLSILLNFTNDQKRQKKFTQAQLAQSKFLEPGDRLNLSIKSTDGTIDLGCQNNKIADI